jgi:hypothetical protein
VVTRVDGVAKSRTCLAGLGIASSPACGRRAALGSCGAAKAQPIAATPATAGTISNQ